jgi:hypothetical protein
MTSVAVPERLRPLARSVYFRTLRDGGRRTLVARWLRHKGRYCRGLGSDLYGDLLEAAAQDVGAGGPCWDVLRTYRPDAHDPDETVGFRFAAALHRLVLAGRAPALAAHFPSAGGRPGEELSQALRETAVARADALRELLPRPLQTNDVSRAPALVGGFLLVGRETGLPLRLLELGASAGLNLRWDRYRYEADGAAWGDPASPVRLAGGFTGGLPPFGAETQVVERTGCDLEPIDPADPEGRLSLLSWIWADQTERLELLRAALDVAAQVPAAVERADALAWLPPRLAAPAPGTTTVVFHSIFARYLSHRARERLRATVEAAGRRATGEAPLAWLRLEGGASGHEVRLALWPGGADRLLARTDAQGRRVDWIA